jgi:hypothetical protein
MAQCPYAWWKPISRNFNPGLMLDPVQGLVIHITDGEGGLEVNRQDFDSPGKGASAHFCIDKKGDMWQFIDTDDRAWAIDGGSNDSHWISIENVAKLGEHLTLEQVTGCAMLLRWLHEQYGVPFKRARSPKDFGLGYHRMFHIGDHACPGRPVVLQLEGIVRYAWFIWWRDTGEDDDTTPEYIKHYR